MSRNGDTATVQSKSDDRLMRILVERIRKGNCILLLGHRIVTSPTDPSVLVSTLLARHLASTPDLKNHPSLVKPVNRDSLRLVTQLYYEMKRDRDDLAISIQDFYLEYSQVTTNFHRNIAALPFKLCISTTPDDFLENSFVEVGKKPESCYYSYRSKESPDIPDPQVEKPVVCHLYGHPSDSDSLVLTESDLIDFLVNVIRGTPSLPDRLRAPMKDPVTSFLFVGFGFRYWYLRVLLKVLNVYGHRNNSIALEDESFFHHPEHSQAVAFFTGDRAIEFKQLSWDVFAQNLRNAYENQSATQKNVAVTASSSAPEVFISYASEDTEQIERLSAYLESENIAVWRDKQSLRGGDRWENILQHVISKQADYVVVAQSKAMLRREEGYFYKEFRTALSRQENMRSGRRFVLPIKLDDCEDLDELENLHVIDSTRSGGFKELADTISDDWRGRQD